MNFEFEFEFFEPSEKFRTSPPLANARRTYGYGHGSVAVTAVRFDCAR